MTSALRSNPRFGWRPWLAATALAALLHLPLLWVQLQRDATQAEPTQMVELLLTPPEPIPVSPPSDWAKDIELKWTLGGEPDPTQAPPQFEPLQGLELAESALSGQLTGLPPRTQDSEPKSTSQLARSAPAGDAVDSQVAEAAETRQATEPSPQPSDDAAPQAPESSLPDLEASIATALAGTAAVRAAQDAVPVPTPIETLEPAQAAEDAVAMALAQTAAVRTPGELSAAAQAILEQPTPTPPTPSTQAATRQTPPPQREQTTRQNQAPQQQAEAEAQYRPDGAAGAYSSDRNAFFSSLAEHLFTVNDQRLRARPYTRRQIVDVRFSIDRKGRVMRVWTPAPRQSAATDAAKAMIWAASPVPQLAPDMPQAVLELTFPVIVGQ